MSHDNWQTKGGQRWNRAEKVRAARRFRHHIRTPSNPAGRIHREPCWFCVQNALGGGYPRLEHLPLVAGHHVDYARPFVVVWACNSHHRQIDHGSLRVPARAVCDYTSLVDAPGVGRQGARYEARTPHLPPVKDEPVQVYDPTLLRAVANGNGGLRGKLPF